jgi:hypothetical protein
MKKLALTLLLVFSLVACSPKFYYFSTETTCPQCVVDSLLGPNTSNYLDWTNFVAVGINEGDSTLISTYVNVVDKIDISVTTYENTGTSTVKKKKLK